MRKGFLGLALCCAGCVYDGLPPPPDPSLQERIVQNARAVDARSRSVARAEPRESQARGTRTCTITNGGKAMLIGTVAGGARRWYLAMIGEEYPGSTIYLRMEGKRYTAREDVGLALTPAMIEALKRDPELDLSWTNWPYGTAEEHKATLTGFTAAFDECEAFLKKPVGSKQ